MNSLLLSLSGSTITSLVAIGFMLLIALAGAIRGFAKTFVQTFGTIIAIVVALLLCAKAAVFLEGKIGIISFFSEKVSGLVEKIFGADVANMTLAEVTDTEQLISDSGNRMSLLFVNIILKVKDSGAPDTATVKEVLSPAFGYYISVAICGLGLFILIKVFFWIVSKIVSKLQKIKIVGSVDRILGFALGVLEGAIWIQIICVIISYLPFAIAQEICTYIAQSGFIEIINSVNLLGIIGNALSDVKVAEFVKNFLAP